jgi:hypothetical protein
MHSLASPGRPATTRRLSRLVGGSTVLLLASVTLAACSSSNGGLNALSTTSTALVTTTTSTPGGGTGAGAGGTGNTGSSGTGNTGFTGETGFGNSGNTGVNDANCSLPTVTQITGQSSSTQQQEMSSWTTIQANGWTAFVPNGDWHISASDAGVNLVSPDGSEGASDDSYSQQSPWTFDSLGAELSLSDVNVICRTTASSSASTTEVTDLTADSGGSEIRGIFSLTIVTPTDSDLFQADLRFVYSSPSEWSSSVESTLLLVMLNAIESPQSP